jgi:hypothetical protein
MDEIIEDAQRVATALGQINDIVLPSELTFVMIMLRRQTGSLWKILIEPMLTELKADQVFSRIWDEKEETQSVTSATVVELANEQLTGSFQIEPVTHARIPWPGFVSPFGPSVYRCKCGFRFGNPDEDLTEETIVKLKQTRNAHFREMFGADINGYPTETSVHFPLHRAVQTVLTLKEFQNASVRNEEMELATARYLQKKGRGNIHVPTIRGDIQFAIESYLECRRKGMTEPGHGEPIDFVKKAKLEQKLILESRTAGKGDWVDPQRQATRTK